MTVRELIDFLTTSCPADAKVLILDGAQINYGYYDPEQCVYETVEWGDYWGKGAVAREEKVVLLRSCKL